MALVLPPSHPYAGSGAGSNGGAPRVRIGIVNIMPRLEAYEPLLLEPLAAAGPLVEPVFIRLASHAYHSSDRDHLDRFYRSFEHAVSDGPLDGLIVTGAPVEELPFEEVRYFRELEHILLQARSRVGVTLGLCWGALALARVLGIGKRVFSPKLFGVFEDRVLVPDRDLLGDDRTFLCAHSRHSGLIDEELERAAAAGVVRALSRGEATGYSLFETPDQRFLGHVGHPEYVGARLAFEWRRDQELGRADVHPPAGFDVEGESPATPWRAHQRRLFAGFVARAARSG